MSIIWSVLHVSSVIIGMTVYYCISILTMMLVRIFSNDEVNVQSAQCLQILRW